MASPANNASNSVIHGGDPNSAALRKGGQKYLKPLKTTSVGAKGNAGNKTNRDTSMPNSSGSHGTTQPRVSRKTKKLGLNEQQNILQDSARKGINITQVDPQQESSGEKVQESTTSIYKSGKNGRQRTRSRADRVYISSMILDAYEKEKMKKREKIQKIQEEIEGGEAPGPAWQQSQVSVHQVEDFLTPKPQLYGKANSPSVYKGGHFGQLIDLQRFQMPTQASLQGQNPNHLKNSSVDERSNRHVESMETRNSVVNVSMMQEQPSIQQYNTITGAHERQAHGSQGSNGLISVMQNDSLNNLQAKNVSTMSRQVYNRLSPQRQKVGTGVSTGNFVVTPKPQQRFDQNGILVDQFYHHKLENSRMNQSLDGQMHKLQSNTGTTNSRTKEFLILNSLHPSLNNSTYF